MSFVPPPTTPRARSLAKAIGQTIEDFHRDNPRLRDHEIHRALQLARARQGSPQRIIVMIMVALGLIVFLLATGVFFGEK